VGEISAKIASIISGVQVILNKGATDGVQVGSAVRLFRKVNVVDPDTKEPLGSTELLKAVLLVTQVEPRFCIAETKADISPLSLLAKSIGHGGEPPSRPRLVRVAGLPGSRGTEDEIEVAVGEHALVNVAEKMRDN
jgi:hypothetical protein